MSTTSFLDMAKLCSKKSEMEMNEDFQKIQSVFNYINCYIKPINKIVFYGGNEPFLTEIASRLKSYLKSRNYLDTNGQPRTQFAQQLKRITFFLMLNTDVVLKHDLTKDVRVCHILNSMPQITLCILMQVIWELKLDNYFYKCIAYCPSWFSLQFLPEAIDSLRHAPPDDINCRMNGLLKANYMNICRMDSYMSTYEHDDKVEKKIILNKMYGQITNLLRRYNTPDADKFEKWSKSKKFRFAGHVLYYLLDVTRRCLHWFQYKPQLEFDEVFELQVEEEKRINNHSNTYSSVLHESLISINTCLLNTLQNVLMTVDMHQFLYWVELDIDEKDPNNRLPPLFEDDEATKYTLQYVIGTSAYRLKELINTNECFSHDVVSQLNVMCIKPQSLEDKLRFFKLGDLIIKLDEINNEDSVEVQKKWFNEFLSRGECVFGNEECMETVQHNIGLFDGENVKLMLQHLESETLDTSEKQLLENCLLNAIDILQTDETIRMVEHMLSLFGPKFSFTEIEDFDNLLIGYFNKTTAANLDVKSYLKIVCQSPRLVHERVFQQLSNLTTEQVKIVVQLFVSTRNIANIFIATYMDDYLEAATDSAALSVTNMENHILFFSELFLKNVVDTVPFMQNMTKQYLMKALMANNYQILWVNLRVLEGILRERNDLKAVEVGGAIPPLLVLLAICLDQTRWDILTYTQVKENCVLTIIGLVGFVVQLFVATADENDKLWITSKIHEMSPSTKYYFQKLNKSDKPTNFDKYVLPEKFAQLDHKQQVAQFCEIFIRSTSKEVQLLAKNQDLWPVFTDGMLMIVKTIFKSAETSTFGSLKYSLTNYIQFIKNCILPSMESQNTTKDYIDLVEKIINIIKHIPVQVYANYFMDLCFLPMSEFIKIILKKASDASEFDDLMASFETLEDCEAKFNLLKIIETERELRAE